MVDYHPQVHFLEYYNQIEMYTMNKFVEAGFSQLPQLFSKTNYVIFTRLCARFSAANILFTTILYEIWAP